MTQTVTVETKVLKQILERLDELTQEVRVLKESLFEKEPTYGSGEWWEWSDKKAIEAHRKGEYLEISTPEELKKIFKA